MHSKSIDGSINKHLRKLMFCKQALHGICGRVFPNKCFLVFENNGKRWPRVLKCSWKEFGGIIRDKQLRTRQDEHDMI